MGRATKYSLLNRRVYLKGDGGRTVEGLSQNSTLNLIQNEVKISIENKSPPETS